MPDDTAAVPGAPSQMQRRLDARERALGLLYEADCKGVPAETVLADLPVTPDPLTVRLVGGVGANLTEIDRELARVARGWSLDRMATLDRAILRIGLYELRFTPEVPTAVVLNEAVELAKRFSTDDSGRFVNGVLARLAADHRPGGGDADRAC